MLKQLKLPKAASTDRSFATDQDPLGENYICDHCDPLLRNNDDDPTLSNDY